MAYWAIVYADFDSETGELIDFGISNIYDSEEDAKRMLKYLHEREVHTYLKIEEW